MYSGTFEYEIMPGTDATSAQINLIVFNLLPVIFGPNVFKTQLGYLLPWIPNWITREFVFGDIALAIIIYFGIVLNFV